MKSRVTTKQGDQGMTRTLAGDWVSKSDPIIECCGWVDALRAQIALLRVELVENMPEENEETGDFLFWLLHCCFLLGTACNDPLNKKPEFRRGDIGPHHLARLEKEQERLEGLVHLPRTFIVSASSLPAAHADIAVTTARTLERHIVRLKEAVPEFDAAHILAFVNRLSDFLYVLARFLENGQHQSVDYSVLND